MKRRIMLPLALSALFLAAFSAFAYFVGQQPTKGTVRLYLSTDCPVAAKYSPRIQELARTYSGKGIRFEALFPNALESVDTVAAYAKERGYSFSVALDPGGQQARRDGITMIPTVVIFDAKNRMIYRGPIDDNKTEENVRRSYAKEILDKLVAGEDIAFSEVPVELGCMLMAGDEAAAKPAPVTYAEHVAPVLYKHCTPCHRPGEVAPFSLTSYEEAKKWAPMIAWATENKRMPPWKAVPNYNRFLDENHLTEDQVRLLKSWAEAGAPRGDASKEPAPPKFEEGWLLGKPDMVLKIDRPFKLEATGRDVYRNFVFKTDFKETKWVRAIDVRPGNRTVVHHVIAFLDERGQSHSLEAKQGDGQPGYSTFGGIGFLPSGSLGGWAPGLQPRFAPEGTAFELKPGTTIVLQVHYHKSGKPEEDQTELALYFAKEPPKRALQLAWIANPLFRIPPGAKDHVVRMRYPVPVDVTAYSAMPHMHLLGKEMKAWVEKPDGTTEPLVWVKDWEFNWQFVYYFQQPKKIPAGSTVHVEAHYDNSAENPNNPNNPPKPVTWGEQTTDEMMLLIVAFSVDNLPAQGILNNLRNRVTERRGGQ
ncbi:MAG: hypothetical protein D6724_03330 [Armatimonadetes bacterium]|nr:MAG: hypothetical protein D6724_03330 [Armatimonadota bacterium]